MPLEGSRFEAEPLEVDGIDGIDAVEPEELGIEGPDEDDDEGDELGIEGPEEEEEEDGDELGIDGMPPLLLLLCCVLSQAPSTRTSAETPSI